MYWLPSYRLTPVSGDEDEDEDDWSDDSFVSSLDDFYRKLVSGYLKEGEEEEEEEEEVEEEEDDVDEGEDSDGSDVVEVYSPTLEKRKDNQGDGDALLALAKYAADSAADGQKKKKKPKIILLGLVVGWLLRSLVRLLLLRLLVRLLLLRLLLTYRQPSQP